MWGNNLPNLYLQAASWFQSQTPLQPEFHRDFEFAWDNVVAHKHFEWHPCFGGFQCARLQVPMDWQGGSTEAEAGKTVELAVIKVEATVPVTDSRYGGAVVTNPGGPGGSGVRQVLEWGYDVRTILSAGPDAENSTAKYFDIISFDPRGVNNTRPTIICEPDHLSETASWFEERGHGIIGSSDTSFDFIWTRKLALSEGCSNRLAEEGIAKHVSTAAVARDVIEIFERHGEWRENEAKRLLSEAPGRALPNEQVQSILTQTAYKPNREMVQYWGFSYGTVLGATLSTMYPDRIHRAVLDGVENSFDYMSGEWLTNLYDTDALLVKMAEYCDAGGLINCPLYVEGGPSAIETNVLKIIDDFNGNPIGIPGDSQVGPIIVTYNDLLNHFSEMVYTPIAYLPRTAQILKDLGERNGSSLAAWKRAGRPADFGEKISEQCKKDGPYSPSCFPGYASTEAQSAILCSDAFPTRYGQSKEDFWEYTRGLIADSSLIGAWWANIAMKCVKWNAPAHWRYNGNFQNKTAHPILFAGNTFDPVTPFRHAITMAKGFEGAGILHQNSEGHCLPASPSLCSGRALRHYFQTGELPGKLGGVEGWDGIGKYCEPDRFPFDGYTTEAVIELPKGETDEDLWGALVHMNRVGI